jgi:4,5-dihydroxyphthalate decarboxylase
LSDILDVSLTLSDNARTQPILDGRVTARGLHIRPTMLHPSEMFWRQLHFAEFDVSEMSLSSLMIQVSRGKSDWVALPVFTYRRFFHTSVLVRRDSGIASPADLAGKRVGVPEYQQTWAVWSRGVLEDEFGLRPQQVEWWMERGQDKSHAAATGFRPPEGVVINQIPPDTDIGEMLLKGELDAALLYLNSPNAVDRARVDLSASDEIRTLFADPDAEARRYYAKTGIFPINHTVVVRRSLLEANPWIARSLYDAFLEAKALGEAQTRAELGVFAEGGLLPADGDPMPYGVARNRTVLETLARYDHDQGLTERRVALDELFAPSLMDV